MWRPSSWAGATLEGPSERTAPGLGRALEKEKTRAYRMDIHTCPQSANHAG